MGSHRGQAPATQGDVRRRCPRLTGTSGDARRRPATVRLRLTSEGPQIRTQLRPPDSSSGARITGDLSAPASATSRTRSVGTSTSAVGIYVQTPLLPDHRRVSDVIWSEVWAARIRPSVRSATGRALVLTAPNPIKRPGCARLVWKQSCRPDVTRPCLAAACSTSSSHSPSRSAAATCSPALGERAVRWQASGPESASVRMW
jgi:hypothetical protein